MEEEVDDADDEEAAGAEGIKEADEDEGAAGASESEEAIDAVGQGEEGMKEAGRQCLFILELATIKNRESRTKK